MCGRWLGSHVSIFLRVQLSSFYRDTVSFRENSQFFTQNLLLLQFIHISLTRRRAETAETTLSQHVAELEQLRLRNEVLTAEAAARSDQLTLLKQSEAELLTDRGWKQEELTLLRAQLEAADVRLASSDEERERSAAELGGLRSLLADMSVEHERLQEEVERLRRHPQQQQQPQPPPDVTAGSQQQQQQQRPDVARSGQHGNPPDLMPGRTGTILLSLFPFFVKMLWLSSSIF